MERRPKDQEKKLQYIEELAVGFICFDDNVLVHIIRQFSVNPSGNLMYNIHSLNLIICLWFLKKLRPYLFISTFKIGLSPSKKYRFICFNESPL